MPAEPRSAAGHALLVAAGASALGAVAGVFVTVILRTAYERAPIWYLVAIGALAGLAAAILVPFVSRPGLHPVPAHGVPETPRTRLATLDDLERRISSGTRRRVAFVYGLQPLLRDLVDDRLIRTMGADFAAASAADPGRTRELVGDELWTWLRVVGRDGRAPTMEELTRIVARVESL